MSVLPSGWSHTSVQALAGGRGHGPPQALTVFVPDRPHADTTHGEREDVQRWLQLGSSPPNGRGTETALGSNQSELQQLRRENQVNAVGFEHTPAVTRTHGASAPLLSRS